MRSLVAITFIFFLTSACTSNPEKVFKKTAALSALSPIQVEITTHLGDGQSFQEGDEISFFLNLDQDAYLLVIYEDASGGLLQLVPSAHLGGAFYQAGLFMPLPDQERPFRLRIQPPFGDEILWVFASDTPHPELKGQVLDNGLKQLQMDIPSLRKKIIVGRNGTFGETKLLIDVKKAP